MFSSTRLREEPDALSERLNTCLKYPQISSNYQVEWSAPQNWAQQNISSAAKSSGRSFQNENTCRREKEAMTEQPTNRPKGGWNLFATCLSLLLYACLPPRLPFDLPTYFMNTVVHLQPHIRLLIYPAACLPAYLSICLSIILLSTCLSYLFAWAITLWPGHLDSGATFYDISSDTLWLIYLCHLIKQKVTKKQGIPSTSNHMTQDWKAQRQLVLQCCHAPKRNGQSNVLKASSPPPMVLSLGIWPSGWIPCSKQKSSQQAFPICTPGRIL